MRSRHLVWLLALALLPAKAQDNRHLAPRVAVADFIVTSAAERYWLGYLYSEVLARRLMRCSGLVVVEPVEVRSRQAGVAARDLDALGQQCLQTAEALDLPWVVSGQLEDRGETVVVTFLVASRAGGKYWADQSMEVPLSELYRPQSELFLERFLRDMGVRSLPKGEWAIVYDYDPGLALDVAELVGEGWRAYAPDAPERAIELWKQAVLRDPECYLAEEAIALASYQYRRALLERSRQLYEKLVAEDPTNAHNHFRLAEVLSDGGDWTRAVQEYRGAVELRPAFLEARLGLGRAYLETGNAQWAEVEFRTVLEQDENNYKAMQNLAVALFRRGRLPDAIDTWRAILAVYPGDPIAQRNLERHQRDIQPTEGATIPGPTPNLVE